MMMRYSYNRLLFLELSQAVGAFGDVRYVDFLKKVLKCAANDYFGGGGDSETQYYISLAAKQAAISLSLIKDRKAVDALLTSALRGKL